jgi:putative SOS response-associated peptidase YedK
VVVLEAFYEHVPRHLAEGRALSHGETPRDAVVEFRPEPAQDILAACVWSRWTAPGVPDLLSFALITEEPPPEVAAAGHDRCIVPLDPRDVDVWLDPGTADVAALDAILDRRLRPYFRHSLAGSSR